MFLRDVTPRLRTWVCHVCNRSLTNVLVCIDIYATGFLGGHYFLNFVLELPLSHALGGARVSKRGVFFMYFGHMCSLAY